MKRPIALLLISIMVLMLSAFSFAGNGNPTNDKDKSQVNAFILDDELFITVWLDKEIGDELDELLVEVVEGEDVIETSSDYDSEEVEKFGTIMYMYTFDAIEYTPLDDFEVKVFISLDDDADSELLLTKKVDLEDLDEEDDDDEEDEDDEEDMDDDMYPAAPAVANKLLKEAGIPNRVEGVNLIALVAGEMNEEAPFGLDEIEDLEDLEAAVEGFLVNQLNDLLEKTHNDLADFTKHFVGMEKTVGKPVVEKINPQQLDEDEDDDNDEEDDDDDDDDEDDDNKGENPGKGNKK